MSKYVHESPEQRRRRREFTRFSKALTSSLPSRLARRDEKSSIAAHNTANYMRTAENLLKKRKAKPTVKKTSLPPRFLTLLKLQKKGGKQKGQWHKSPELVELLGGYVPNPPKGVTEWRWWTALAMAFLRRHPHLHKDVEKAYHLAEYWVPDPWLIRTARDMLPPLDGSWRDFVGTEGGTSVRKREGVDQRIVDSVEAGNWKQRLENSLENRGYMAFTWSMNGRDIVKPNEVAHAAPGDFDNMRLRTRQEGEQSRIGTAAQSNSRLGTAQTRGSGSFTAEAAKKIEQSILESGKIKRTWLTDAELEERYRCFEIRAKRAKRRKRQNKALNKEFEKYLSRPGKSFRVGDPVQTCWRATSDWDQPRVNSEWYDAKVSKVYSDGSVDICLQDDRGETYRRVDKEYVKIDRVALAILSAKEGMEKDRAQENSSENEHNGSTYDEMAEIYKARQARGGGPARRHAGIDALLSEWSQGISVKAEDRRLSKYLGDNRPEFSTRGFRNTSLSKTRRDHSDLREKTEIDPAVIRRMRRRRAEESTTDQVISKMLHDEKTASLENELKRIEAAPALESNVAVGSLRGEVLLKRAKEKARKEKERRKKVLKNVVDSERILALSILKYEDKLEEVRRELVSAIEMHKTAALQTEMIHAFDGVTTCLNETRWATCAMIEALVEWRKAKMSLIRMDPSLSSEAHKDMALIEKNYDPLEDPDVDEMGMLDEPGALPFVWNGNNILLQIESGLDFLSNSSELCEWYGKHFSMVSNPFMVVTPLAERAFTPRKYTQTVLVNGEEVEHEVPRLKELAGKAVKKLRAVKEKQFNCSFWWPGQGMRPAEFERVRRAEKEIVQELRREKLRNKQAMKDLQERVKAQQSEVKLSALDI